MTCHTNQASRQSPALEPLFPIDLDPKPLIWDPGVPSKSKVGETPHQMVLRSCRRQWYLAGQWAVVPGLASKVLSILWHLHGALRGRGCRGCALYFQQAPVFLICKMGIITLES